MTALDLTDEQYARLTSLHDQRRWLEGRRKRAKHVAASQLKTLAEKVADDRRFADELAGLNQQIQELTTPTGGHHD